MTSTGIRHTAAMRKRFADLYRQGVQSKEIQAQLGISTSTMSRWRRALNIPRQHKTYGKTIKVYLPRELHVNLDHKARSLHMTTGSLVRVILRKAILQKSGMALIPGE